MTHPGDPPHYAQIGTPEDGCEMCKYYKYSYERAIEDDLQSAAAMIKQAFTVHLITYHPVNDPAWNRQDGELPW